MRSHAERRNRAVLAMAVVTAALIVPVAGGIAAAKEASVVPPSIVGSWSRNVTQANYDKYGPGQGGFVYVGVWTMTIKKAGGVDFFPPGGYIPNCKTCAGEIAGRFSVAGARLTVSPMEYECPTKGVYAWKVSGRALTLKVMADKKCGPRAALFTGLWKKRK